MSILKKHNLALMATSLLFFYSCRDIAVPKPKGYFRIDLPSKEYILFKGVDSLSLHLPLSFEYPLYGRISLGDDTNPEPGWFNIDFPFCKARIYLTYKNIRNNLAGLMEETYKMNVKNHISKADAINEMLINDPDRKVYGILYDLKGNTATAVQFFVTDSTKHFLRGSLYFSAEPNPDSLAPVNEFFREDIIHMIETLKWKKE